MGQPQGTHIKLFFSEYGHEAYQSKGNETYNSMLANSLLLHLPLTPWVSQKINLFSLLSSYIAYQINQNEA